MNPLESKNTLPSSEKGGTAGSMDSEGAQVSTLLPPPQVAPDDLDYTKYFPDNYQEIDKMKRGEIWSEFFKEHFVLGTIHELFPIGEKIGVSKKHIDRMIRKYVELGRICKLPFKLPLRHEHAGNTIYFNPVKFKSIEEVILNYLYLFDKPTFDALNYIINNRISFTSELQSKFAFNRLLVICLAKRGVLIKGRCRKGKEYIFHVPDVTESEFQRWYDRVYVPLKSGKNSYFAKQGFKFQHAVKDRLLHEFEKHGMYPEVVTEGARISVVDDMFEFDYLIKMRTIFNIPFTVAIEVKNFVLTTISSVLYFRYKIDRALKGNVLPIMITRGARERIFKRANELGIWIIVGKEDAKQKVRLYSLSLNRKKGT